MSSVRCPRYGALACTMDNCEICTDEGLIDPELVDYGKPSERSMEYLSELFQEDES